MIDELATYYRENGISAIDFNCQYFSICSRYFPSTFTTAKEAFVSSRYVTHELPRIVFISLDSGSAETDPTLKTHESVRQWEEEGENVLGLHRNKHWFRTQIKLSVRLEGQRLARAGLKAIKTTCYRAEESSF
jgi:hypothetical protein